jgi:hypothetical protein
MGIGDRLIEIITLSEAKKSDIRSGVKYMKELILTESNRGNAASAISNRLTRNAALKAAGLGGLVSVPSGIPGLGTMGTVIVGATVDMFYLTKIQAELCYGISAAFDAGIDEEELKTITLVLIGFAGTAGAAKEIVKASMKEGMEVIIRRYLRQGVKITAEEVAERTGMKTAGRALPLVGIPLGAAANFYSTILVGRKAKEYFRGVS